MKLKITIGDKYRLAMEITDQAEADRYWKECVEHNMRCQKAEGTKPDRAKAESVERQNLGYYAGYYSHETRERVERLFRCAHPVFGRVAEHKPTPKEAFDAGRAAGARSKGDGTLGTKSRACSPSDQSSATRGGDR